MRASLVMAYDIASEESEPVIITSAVAHVTLVLDDGRSLTFDREDLLQALELDEPRERAA